MSKLVIVNASPRAKGTSAMLAELCRAYLEGQGLDVSVVSLYQSANGKVVDAVLAADTVVISGPCYVNSYPAPVIRLLDEWAARYPHGQRLYGMIQGGMPYPHTHKSGLNMLEVFAERTGLLYSGGFVLGLGALLDGGELEKLPNGRKAKRQLAVFFANIRDGKPSTDEVYEKARMRVPGIVARILSRVMNRSIDKKFAARGMNAYDDPPYKFDALTPL